MATISSLVSRVRFELGDLGKTFVDQFVADGTTNRFKLNYSPVDALSATVFKNGVDVTSTSSIEESTGSLLLVTVPASGDIITVSGTYYRYFTATELASLVTDAVSQHANGHRDSVGQVLTVTNLPAIEEYPVAIYATTLALYTLATDASFDIDIAAPDGVNIPRSERYRQLMEMVQQRQIQYRDLCVQLGVGMYRIDVFTLRRQSKATGRYVPVYKPQEVDDRSYPERVHDQLPTYGDKNPAWPSDAGEFLAYQGRSWTTSIDFSGSYSGFSFLANLLNQRGSVLVVQTITMSVVDHKSFTITGVTRTAGTTVATITAPGATFSVGDSISVIGVNTEFNQTWTVTAVVDANNFTVATTATTAVALTGLTGVASLNGVHSYTATLSLTADQTLRLANRTYLSLSVVNPTTLEQIEVKGGNFFTERVSSIVI